MTIDALNNLKKLTDCSELSIINVSPVIDGNRASHIVRNEVFTCDLIIISTNIP